MSGERLTAAHRGRVPLDFTIVTPSRNMLDYLKRCRASVADQEGVTLEHVIVDAESTDGTRDWLAHQPSLIAIVGRDRGMYDALNKGFERCTGSFIAYLNCDEQYLPGALGAVKRCFVSHPEADIVFGNVLLVRPDGSLIAYRKTHQPRWYYILASHLYVLTCATFLRRRILEEGFRFDISWRDIGDEDFVVRLLRHGYKTHHVRRYVSAFTMTGTNMSRGTNASLESNRARTMAPRWIRWFRYPLNALRLTEKCLSGAYFQRMPLRYGVYADGDAGARIEFCAARAGFRWRTG